MQNFLLPNNIKTSFNIIYQQNLAKLSKVYLIVASSLTYLHKQLKIKRYENNLSSNDVYKGKYEWQPIHCWETKDSAIKAIKNAVRQDKEIKLNTKFKYKIKELKLFLDLEIHY